MQFKSIILSLVFSSVIASAPLAPKSDVVLTKAHEGPHDSNLARRSEEQQSAGLSLARRQEDHAAHQHHHHDHAHAHAQKKKLARRHEGPHDGLARRGLTRRQFPEELGAMELSRRSSPHEGPHDGLARRALKRRQAGRGSLARRSPPHEGPHDGLARRNMKTKLSRRASTHEGPHDGLARRALNHRDRRSNPESNLSKNSRVNRRTLGGLLNASQTVGSTEGAPDAATMGDNIMKSMIKN
jgi:hypothetical protein